MGENMWGHESFPQQMYSYTKPSHYSRGLSGTGTPVQGPQLWAESSRGKRGFSPEVAKSTDWATLSALRWETNANRRQTSKLNGVMFIEMQGPQSPGEAKKRTDYRGGKLEVASSK